MTTMRLGAAGILLVTLAGAAPAVAQQTAPVDSSIVIHEQHDFEQPPARIYAALTDGKIFTAFTGAPATIDAREGGALTLFGGVIVARNIELVPDRRVVQAWRADDWPEGVFSIVRFELTPHGTGTRLVFDHIGFPAGLRAHLVKGWQDHYWALLSQNLK